jgi:hypothetical protein
MGSGRGMAGLRRVYRGSVGEDGSLVRMPAHPRQRAKDCSLGTPVIHPNEQRLLAGDPGMR